MRLTTIASSLLIPAFAVTALVAAESSEPVFDATMPDVMRTLARWEQGIIGGEWADKRSDPLRQRLHAWNRQFTEEHGIDPLATLAACAHLRVQAGITAGAGSPWFRLQADLGGQSGLLFEAIAAHAERLPDGLLAIGDGPGRMVIRRAGNLLLATGEGGEFSVPLAVAQGRDLHATFAGPALAAALRSAPSSAGMDLPWDRYLPLVTGGTDVIPQGLASSWRVEAAWTWLRPARMASLSRLPATVTDVVAVGIDGAALWEEMVAPALAAAQRTGGIDPEERLRQVDPAASWKELIGSMGGTWAFAVSPAMPLPGYTVIAPRTPALDRFIERLVASTGSVCPEEGASMPLALPAGVPVLLTLARDRGCWLLTTDPALAPSWLAADPTASGWLASPLGALAVQRAGTDACLVGVTDTAAQLRTYVGMAGMAMAAVPQASPAERQAVLGLLTRLAARSQPTWMTLRPAAGGFSAEAEGSSIGVGGIGAVAIVAAIAIPNLLESRVVANESAAAATLKSGIFPGQVQFQGGAYLDADANGIGEYTDDLALMAGKHFTSGGRDISLNLLSEKFNADPVETNGYRYATYAFGEKGFVAYALPLTKDQGRRMFALSSTGTVYSRLGAGPIPAPSRFLLWDGRQVDTATAPPATAWKPYLR